MKKYERVTTSIFAKPKPKIYPMSGEKLRAARETLSLTQTQLGAALGPPGRPYTKRTVISWELEQNDIPQAVEKLVGIMLRYPRLVSRLNISS
jgi:DNA-binding transcriptional regulator YiaG